MDTIKQKYFVRFYFVFLILFSCSSSANEFIALGKWSAQITYSSNISKQAYSDKNIIGLKAFLKKVIHSIIDSNRAELDKYFNPQYAFSYLPWAMPVNITGQLALLCYNQMQDDIFLREIYKKKISVLLKDDVKGIFIERNDTYQSSVITPYQIIFSIEDSIKMHLHVYHVVHKKTYSIVGFALEKNGVHYSNPVFGKRLMALYRAMEKK